MYIFAYLMQILALLAAIGAGMLALLALWNGRAKNAALVEKAHWVISGALALASALLLHALFWKDFSLQYVANYTDLILPLSYRLTAFWAGQPGSMLFWALAVALSGSLFATTRAYSRLSPETRLWFWVFFYSIMGFFALILTSFSNPFVLQQPAPPDGNGLNPLLQNPGMIFHPPLLFLGYGGFTVPSCLALAQCLTQRQDTEGQWFALTRPFLLLAWIFLTAGIILGAWWAYMELGWGGYWAWDPVENASLIPWLIGTACLHTLIVQHYRGKLGRVNVTLIALTTVSAFFATFLVRSGIIDSVHAFGSGGVAMPLTVFVLAGLAVAFYVPLAASNAGRPLEGLLSREGLLALVPWVLLALAAIILLATMWPVINKLWADTPRGLDAQFYNTVCLPLGGALLLLLAACPWLDWRGGLRAPSRAGVVLCVFAVTAIATWALGYRQPVALLATASAVAIGVGCAFQLVGGAIRGRVASLGALGAHCGMALVAMGIAFSGPYSTERDLLLGTGESATVNEYTVTLRDIGTTRHPGYEALVAQLDITRGGAKLGNLAPERRIYDKFGSMQFSEVDTIPKLGDELYASLLGLDENSRVMVRFSIKPLVNWFWIGGVLMCLLPLLALARRKPVDRAADDA